MPGAIYLPFPFLPCFLGVQKSDCRAFLFLCGIATAMFSSLLNSYDQTTCRMYTWIFAFSNDIMIVMRYNHMWSLEWKAELARLHILWFCLRVCKFQIPLRMFLMRRFVFQSTLSVMCVIMLRQGTHANICTWFFWSFQSNKKTVRSSWRCYVITIHRCPNWICEVLLVGSGLFELTVAFWLWDTWTRAYVGTSARPVYATKVMHVAVAWVQQSNDGAIFFVVRRKPWCDRSRGTARQ